MVECKRVGSQKPILCRQYNVPPRRIVVLLGTRMEVPWSDFRNHEEVKFFTKFMVVVP